MSLVRNLAVSLLLVLAMGPAYGQEGHSAEDAASARNIFYIGGGKTRTDDHFDNDDRALSVGFMHQLAGRKLILGGDIGREGTMLDSTWNQDERPKQATSYNLLIGRNFLDDGTFRVDGALLLGIRESAADCPRSYLGYQCYADTEPDTDYKGNVGAVISVSVNRFTLGLRATGESTQAIVGFRF